MNVAPLRRRLLLLTVLIVPGCGSLPQNNLGHSELVSRYAARFEVEVEGEVLPVEVLNPGGLNIVSLKAVVRGDKLLVGGARASSGPPERRRLTVDVSPFELGPQWYERVYWAGFNDEPATRLNLKPQIMSPGERPEP